MTDAVIEGLIKALQMREALASCQMEGIGKDLTLSDLYLAELVCPKCDGSGVERESDY